MLLKTTKNIIFVGHLIFWLAHWCLAFWGFKNLAWNGFSTHNGLLYKAFVYGILTNMVLFYWQYFFIIPKYFIKKDYVRFFIYTISFFLLITALEGYLNIYFAKTNGLLNKEISSIQYIIIWLLSDVIFNVLYSGLGFLFRFPLEYFKSEKIKQNIIQENHKSELKYLKAQLNPHFLFNGINSIYHLIGKNNTLAKDTLLRFSDLLRYQLYESGSQKIALKKEFDYMAQYIKMEHIRKGNDIVLEYSINFENETKTIAPLLLLPFVENAFKHVSNYDNAEENSIFISIQEHKNTIDCVVENTFDVLYKSKKNEGIGLQNVKRRLTLLYPESHDLKIFKKEEKIHVVLLKINL